MAGCSLPRGQLCYKETLMVRGWESDCLGVRNQQEVYADVVCFSPVPGRMRE